MKKIQHALLVGLPVLAGLFVVLKPLVPPEAKWASAFLVAMTVVNYLVQSPLVRQEEQAK